ncbi:hypothetical protein BV25DRAFT_1805892 [Artomyces pyxidatus]|uniref:Uncharacterized protein n=1 Tax=Artomyces pyxidatus TaxID=48021 RepID=A0ACB8SZ70_9AGAM|nr:hypothetical protein BV25DRAFT_1805892 [Artomyces pyxidatus]
MAQSTLPRKHPYPDLESDDVEAQALLKGLNNYLGVTEPQRPPLLVKITGYRLVTTAVIAGLGVPKAIASYEGQSVVPTTLDWVSGVAAAVILYWIGLFEAADPPVLKWLLHDDYGPAILKVVRVFILSICAPSALPVFAADRPPQAYTSASSSACP